MILLGWKATSQYFPFNKDLLIAGEFWQLHAYLLSNFGARKLLEIHDKIEMPLDVFISRHIKKVKIFGTINDICIQKNHCGYSNIQTYNMDLKKDKSIYYFRNVNNRAFSCLSFSDNGNYLACGEGYCTRSEIFILDLSKLLKLNQAN